MGVGGDSDQNADLEEDLEDLDALVDPETQRIMDEADLLDYVSPFLSGACLGQEISERQLRPWPAAERG